MARRRMVMILKALKTTSTTKLKLVWTSLPARLVVENLRATLNHLSLKRTLVLR